MKQIKILLISIILLSLILWGCSSSQLNLRGESELGSGNPEAAGEIQNFTATNFAMGTLVSENIFTTGEDITQEIVDILTDVENDLLSWRVESSEVAQINASAGQAEGCQVSDQTGEYLRQILELSEKSGGAMDPTLGRLIREWDIDGDNPHIPDQSVIDGMLAQSGYESVRLEESRIYLPEDMTLDLGSVGKGIGCDQVMERLKQDKAIMGALISLGGSSIVTYGNKEDGTTWKVAVLDPRNEEGAYLGVISLEGSYFMSTSGDYEKYFEEDGVRYHHILDPSDGYPSRSGLISATIISRTETGLVCDGLSTACLVLGLEKAKNLLAQYDVQAVLVDEDKNVYLTGKMQEQFELLSDDYMISGK